MKVLVIGSAGYVGRRLVPRLREAGVVTIGVDAVGVAGLVDQTADLRFPEQTMGLLYEIRPDVVINLAYMLMEASAARPHAAVQLNILGVNGLFDAAVNLGVPRVVYASSGAVYGDQKDHGDTEVSEETPTTPRTLYGQMKQFNEGMAEFYNSRGATRLISVRLSSLHGRGKQGTFTPMDMIVDAVGKADKVTLPWSADHETSFIHVDDAVDVFVQLALAVSPRWTVYNSGGDHLTMGDLARFGNEITGLKIACAEPGRELLHVSRVDSTRVRTEFPGARRTPREWLELEVNDKLRTAPVPLA